MPIKLGEKVQCGTLNAEHDIHCQKLVAEQLEVPELGSLQNPVQTIHRASTDIFQNDLKFVESNSGEARLIIRTDGHLAVSQDVEFYSGTDIETGIKKFSMGLNPAGDKFVIKDEINGNDILTLDSNGLDQSSIAGLANTLSDKQASLTLPNGTAISTTVLDTFQLVSDADGPSYATSLLTAGAIENWFETLQSSLLMIQPGNMGPGYRASSISTTTTPSGTNVPSSLAVSNFVTTKLSPVAAAISVAYHNIDEKAPLNGSSTENFDAQTLTCTSIVATTATLYGDLYFDGSGDSLSAQLANKAPTLNPTFSGLMEVPGSSAAHSGTIGSVPNVNGVNNVGFAKTNRFNGTDYAILQYDGGAVNVNARSGSSLSFTKDHVNRMVCGQDGNWTIQTQLTVDGALNSRLIQPIDDGVRSIGTSALNYATVHTRNVASNTSLQLSATQVDIGNTSGIGNIELDADLVKITGTLQVPGNNATTTGSFGELTGKSNNYCAFAQTNNFNQTDYALAQMSGGVTSLNAKAGKQIIFSQGGPQTNQVMVCGASGNWNIANDLIVDGSLTVNGQGVGSDDRLKIDEQPILNALNAIRQVQPQTYIKLKNESETDGFPSSGVIAQQLNEIPDLQYCVNIPETDTTTEEDDAGEPVTKTNYWSVNYNGLFTHLLAAVKELDLVVQQQAARIQILEG